MVCVASAPKNFTPVVMNASLVTMDSSRGRAAMMHQSVHVHRDSAISPAHLARRGNTNHNNSINKIHNHVWSVQKVHIRTKTMPRHALHAKRYRPHCTLAQRTIQLAFVMLVPFTTIRVNLATHARQQHTRVLFQTKRVYLVRLTAHM